MKALAASLLIGVALFCFARPARADAPPEFSLSWGSLGSGPGELNIPVGVTLDAQGNVYVADQWNHRIHKFTAAGQFLLTWGSPGSGNGEFNYPSDIAMDSDGNIYVADTINNRVQKFTADGQFLMAWGSWDPTYWGLSNPYCLVVDHENNVYATDYNNHRVLKFTSDGAFLLAWGAAGAGNGEFQYPLGIDVDGMGDVYVADQYGQRIQKFDSNGAFLLSWGSEGSGDGQFQMPFGVAVDGSGSVYVADTFNHRIQKFTSAGQFLCAWGSQGTDIGQFDQPFGVAADGSGNVYVADAHNHRIQKFAYGTLVPPATLRGIVTAECGGSTFLRGVTIDVYDIDSGSIVASVLTGQDGAYSVVGLAAGRYQVSIVTPLGYAIEHSEVPVTMEGVDQTVSFDLTCIDVTARPRAVGFWKHQVSVAMGGKGTAQVSATNLCAYLDRIEGHFNHNRINPVVVYIPPASGQCTDKLAVAQQLINLRGMQTATAYARQQLLTLLLNVASGKLPSYFVISDDEATVSQAITFCDRLIDDPLGNHETAATVADCINSGVLVAAGVIALETEDIPYAWTPLATTDRLPGTYALGQNTPNPFNPATVIHYDVPAGGGDVSLRVYDVSGLLVRTLVDGAGLAGNRTATWNGRNDQGQRVASGVYFYRMTAPGFVQVRKMVLVQ